MTAAHAVGEAVTGSTVKRVLVAGGGVAGLEALLALRHLAGGRVKLTLLAQADEFIYRPMAVAEPFGRGHASHHSLSVLADALGARLVRGTLKAVDPAWRIAVTSDGASLAYDMLLVAVGARPKPALHAALTWTPEADPSLLGGLLRDIEEGYSKQIAFVAPPGVAWTLPLYELALMTAAHAWSMGQDDVKMTIYTPERAPLALLGARASEAMRRELQQAGIELRTSVCVFDDVLAPGRLVVHGSALRRDEPQLASARVVSLPRAVAPRITGLPQDADGFLPVDHQCRVRRAGAVWAAGDITDFPIKQGGLATQQADAAAEAMAAAAGAKITPTAFKPTLRGVMLTGRSSRWAPTDLEVQEPSAVDGQQLWWPPAKIAGRYLTPFLADLAAPEENRATRPVGFPFSHELEEMSPEDVRAPNERQIAASLR